VVPSKVLHLVARSALVLALAAVHVVHEISLRPKLLRAIV
jgi:hypothetical protein